MNTFLLEIGTEEIPAGYIEPALDALSQTLLKKMDDARIDHGEATIMGTPRRLAVSVENVAEKQKPLTTEMLGPPERVGFDENGKPTMAAEKFAEKSKVKVGDLKIKDTDKGRYLYALIREKGRSTKTVLREILPRVILSTPFPKSMRWADFSISFARPIHFIVALYGDQIVSFTLENLKSGRHTLGHRFLHPSKVKISRADDYQDVLSTAHVVVDFDKRKSIIQKEVAETAQKMGGRVLRDEKLLDIVNNLVEYPAVVAGTFENKYLALPDEVLITVMRNHQKYFAVVDEDGALLPCFITVNNTPARDMNLVARGNERVLRARLADAEFFYNTDLNEDINNWVDKLKGVLFQAQLGTMFEKMNRVRNMAEYIAGETSPDTDLKEKAGRAAYLCKADLITEMVGEFPDLQGIMGRVYVKVAGESEEVAMAIEEHYRPTHSGGTLPETQTGSVLSIADKMDTICGCFSAGLVPTGASDPYALRRQGIGIVQIMLKNLYTFSLKRLIEHGLSLYGEKAEGKVKEITDSILDFLMHRISHMLSEQGYSKDVIQAVVSVSIDNIPDTWNRVRALENLKSRPDFEPLAIAFKRVVNIIKKEGYYDTDAAPLEVNVKLFEDDSETGLYNANREIREKVRLNLIHSDYEKALQDIASLKEPVDNFFDSVMVMTEDMKIRENRLALLKNIAELFDNIADFSKIATK